MSYSHILFHVEESGIALLTVNRPEKLNALSGAIVGELADAFGRVAGDSAIRAAIVTGAGEKAFVAGADIQRTGGAFAVEMRARSRCAGRRRFRILETCGKPSVAAVNGFALGGGLELAMACTVRFASENAKLGQPEVKLGIIPGYGGTQRLPRLVGRGRALELLLAGDPISAAEAHRIGLVNAVVPQAELAGSLRAWLAKVLANGPLALGLVMDAVDTGLDCGLEEGLAIRGGGVRALVRPPKMAAKARGRFWKSGARRLRESEIWRRVIEGQLSAAGLRFAIVVSRFNGFITERLLAARWMRWRAPARRRTLIDVIKVPGSWEVPLVASEVARQHRYDAHHLPERGDSRRDARISITWRPKRPRESPTPSLGDRACRWRSAC